MSAWMEIWWQHAPVLSVVLPSLTAVVVLLLGDQGGMAAQGGSHQVGRLRWHRWVGMASALLGLAMAMAMVWRASSGEIMVYRLGEWPAPFGIVLVMAAATSTRCSNSNSWV